MCDLQMDPRTSVKLNASDACWGGGIEITLIFLLEYKTESSLLQVKKVDDEPSNEALNFVP